eukprot:767530-Hanusia_phi.AAC.11
MRWEGAVFGSGVVVLWGGICSRRPEMEIGVGDLEIGGGRIEAPDRTGTIMCDNGGSSTILTT